MPLATTSPARSLLPTLLPLAAWFAADALAGPLAALVTGCALALGALVLVAVREGRLDKGPLADIALMALLSVPDLLPAGTLPEGTAGAALEIVLALLLAPAFRGRLPRLATNGLKFPPPLLPVLARLVAVMAGILFLHGLLALLAALFPASFPSDPSGPWYWLAAAVLLAAFILRTRSNLKHGRLPGGAGSRVDDPDEWLDIVDPSGRPVARARRSLVHGRKDLIHPVVRLAVLSPDRTRLLLQKRRADRKAAPGLWDTAAAGHITSGEEPEAALRREAFEEIGLRIGVIKGSGDTRTAAPGTAVLLERYMQHCPDETELSWFYTLTSSGPFRMDATEMDALRFVTRDEYGALADAGAVTQGLARDTIALKKAGLLDWPG